jgi:hypothetical protein
MFSVPLAVFGALLTLFVFRMSLNIYSQIGLIMLIGLVTKNAILIVEYSNQRRARGEDLIEAVVNASRIRLRPILMTTLTTILGVLPIALGIGAGAESRKPLGMAVVGGLLFSMFLTLMLVPVVYTLLARWAPARIATPAGAGSEAPGHGESLRMATATARTSSGRLDRSRNLGSAAWRAAGARSDPRRDRARTARRRAPTNHSSLSRSTCESASGSWSSRGSSPSTCARTTPAPCTRGTSQQRR